MATAAPVSSAPSLPAPRKGVASGRWRPSLCDAAYAREMLLPMSLGLLVLMCALAGNFVYWAINSIINQGMSVSPIVRLFLLSAPGFAVQGIPVGVILAVCLVLNRAVRDNEITALRVGGASVPRILAPFLAMALLATVADWWVLEKVAPKTNDLAKETMLKLMSAAPARLIESDRYFHAGNYYFYVGTADSKTGELRDVLIYQKGDSTFSGFALTPYPTVMIARSAKEDPKKPNRWILTNVVVHAYDTHGRQQSQALMESMAINVGQQISTYWAEQKDPFAMTSDELSHQINDLQNAAFDPTQLQTMRVDYYRKRGALPFACFVMALLAAPLALRFARQGSFAGLVCAFGLAFFWQGFDGWLRALGIAGYLPPIVAAWGTNALFAAAGMVMLWRER